MTSMSNTVLVFDLKTITDRSCPPKVFTGLQSTFYAKGASRGSRIASGSQDRKVYVWDINRTMVENNDRELEQRPDPLFSLGCKNKLNGHLHEVNEVAWARDTRLLSSSDDASVLVWDLIRNY